MKLAFIGIGKVGFALANHLQKKGHEIIIAHHDIKSESVLKAQEKNPAITVLGLQEAIDAADVIFLAIPFKASEETLKPLQFKGKTLVDCTNPIGAGISHGLESKISGAEKTQEWAKDAKVVKCFSIYGFENLENSKYPNFEVKPVMLMAGNDDSSKKLVRTLISDLGFESLDTGNLSQSLHIEHMTLLWVKMVRANGYTPNFTWAYLER